jgi:quercetin dioxygenase-like cupin family protein
MDTTSLADMARAHIERARAAVHGRSAHTLHGGHDRALRQTVIALRAGQTLSEHDSSRDATLQVLFGAPGPVATASIAGPVYSWQEDWE